jgi:hypothetical protein
LWQLAFCSGSLFKMGVSDSHGNVRLAEAIDAAGKIFLRASRSSAAVRTCVAAAPVAPIARLPPDTVPRDLPARLGKR